MFFSLSRRAFLPAAFPVAVCLLSGPPAAHAWGNEGHRMLNRLAAQTLPPDVPAFLKTPAALDEMEYLGPEPDRWRSVAEPELKAVQAPEHFINLELADKFRPLPHTRFDFESEVFAAGERPETIGLQPWQTVEVWERLKVAMREYRTLSAEHKDTHPVEQTVLFYAGWLGHYVADGSQPLHTSVQYNGWVGPNPNGYTTSHQIHWEFEGPFVDANIHPADVEARMTATKAVQGNLFAAYMVYLRHTYTFVDRVYELEKQGGFTGAGTPESRDFTAERLAAGASMLRDMIYSAWLASAAPAPVYQPAK